MLKDAVREARIEAAERSAVVVDLRDAELARLELLNEALDPVFKDIPDDVELFDRGVSKGDVPRLWIDVIAHVEMGRDKRQYRFVQDTRYGRAVLAESYEVPEMVQAVTRYVARRLVERERALADDAAFGQVGRGQDRRSCERCAPALRCVLRRFVFGLIVGAAPRCSRWRCSASRIPNPTVLRRRCSYHRAGGADAARDHLAAPGAGRAVDGVEIIGGGVFAHAGRGRGRRHADRRHARAVRAAQPVEHVQMIVAVQHQLGAVRGDDAQEFRGVESAACARLASLTGG